MAEEIIFTTLKGKIATLTFHRPEKLNALNFELVENAVRQLQDWGRNPDIAAIVVTGAGRAFCAGGDISIMASDTELAKSLEERTDDLRRLHELSWTLRTVPKITIAAVNGPAMGAGFGICLACDLRYASERARFGTAYAKIGFSGDFGVTWLLTRCVGAARAKELLLMSETIEPVEAMFLGLVNRVVPHDQLESTVYEIASRLAAGPLVSFRYIKENVNLAETADFRTLLDREAETQRRCALTLDHREGIRAFLEKRPPHFTGQ
jgi:2-(1,2-epoxy-1,2-dihydrophenyl)acetyl-CoA isomerase